MLKLYNTMTRKKEEFKPITPGEIKIYGCGPTVYNFIHIGNARPICVFDAMRRYMEYRGFKVTYVQNFTDIDDKIIKKAIEEKSDYSTVSKRYIKEYKKDAEGLNVKEASIAPLATENINSVVDIILTLMEKGYAYEVNGDVYFRTKKFNEYGKLSHQPLEDLEAGARISVGEQKEDPMDFALWKASKPGEPFWEVPWGKGRPGWHIECSAMARKYLGNTIDIHCGGRDLIFPHHENEIAQSECCNGVPFANYWIHNGYINVDNQKMSKSLNNFFTVRDVADKYGYEPIRYLMIASHYRSPINYSIDIIEQCKSALDRLYTCRDNLEFKKSNVSVNKLDKDDEIIDSLSKYKDKFIAAMDDDLNTADALSVIFDLVKDINININSSTNVSKQVVEYALDIFNELTSVLGLLYQKSQKSSSVDDKVKELIEKREKARKEKNWATADAIRDELKNMNVVLEDTPQGVKWTIVSK